MVAEKRSSFSHCLRDAERSLAKQSTKHPDGWGVAFFQSESWRLHKSVACADDDAHFDRVASESADVLVAHVRKMTVGDVSRANTHPFQRERWVFAHNGTIKDLDYFERQISKKRASEIVGETDSEMLFAYLLTAMDAEGEAGIQNAVSRMRASRVRGSFNFVLSDGEKMFAYRFGRPLFVLARKSTTLPRGVLVASTKFTTEDWRIVPEDSLLRIDRDAPLSIEWLVRTDPSMPELPFTD